MTLNAPNMRPMGERTFGRMNWLGLATLIEREVRRFTKVWSQTLLAPVVTSCLFMVIFTLAFAARRGDQAAEFVRFLAPGILMMSIIQNAFANTSSSLLSAKMQGNIVDTLMPPLSALELTLGYLTGGVARGVVVAVAVVLAIFPFIGLSIAHPVWAIGFVLMGSAFMALLGLMAAIIAQKFDHMSAFTNFVVTPLSFLSGTFYSITILPGWAQVLSQINPFFYMIDGARFGVLGISDSAPAVGLSFLLLANIGLGTLVWWWFRTGYRLKA